VTTGTVGASAIVESVRIAGLAIYGEDDLIWIETRRLSSRDQGHEGDQNHQYDPKTT
jgi:hypothetical protein